MNQVAHPNPKVDVLYCIRHSLAHILAQAVQALRPGSTLGFGPPIENGFYYDFILSSPITEEDFPALEEKMRELIKERQEFSCEDLPAKEAFKRLTEMDEPYKREYAEELVREKGLKELRFYQNGPFVDMCEGPHVANSREIPTDCFKIKSVAGAYWRGSERNVMMTRIYVWAFRNKKELKEFVAQWELAQTRDHKKLGKELEIFTIDPEIGKGLPLWLPNGTVIRDELEKLARELEFKDSYQRVATPHIARAELYYQTGHLPYYAEVMFPLIERKEVSEGGEQVTESYALRPMNCPHHHRIFAHRKRSYRELPVRLAEYGQVYRNEDSGAVSGLLRVRGMCTNDAHIYCEESQIKDEVKKVILMYQEAYRILGIQDFFVRLSTSDFKDPKGKEKFIDNPEAWRHSEKVLEELLKEMQIDYVEGVGEAAFYGPKIDIQLKTITGRDETVSTVQLDFAVPERLGLNYTGSDGQPHVPYVIHRAPLSTHERMVAFLIEFYGGAFPLWLAPIQVRVIPVSDFFRDYAEKIVNSLREQWIRAELAPGSETVGKQIKIAITEKIPHVLVVGEREVETGEVCLRKYGDKHQTTLDFSEYQNLVLEKIRTRALER